MTKRAWDIFEEACRDMDRWDDLEDYTERRSKRQETCLHQNCTKCGGSGADSRGYACVHMISCSCSKCTPRF